MRMWRYLAVAGLAAGLVARAAPAAEVLHVGTPEATAFNMSLLDVGVQAGIFARHGLDVERMDFAGSAKLYPAMVAGAVEIAMGSGSDLLFIARGLPMKAVAVWQTRPDDLSLLTRSDGKVTEIAQLKGRKVGVAGPGGLTLWVAMSAARKQGWGPAGMEYVFLGGVPSIIAGLVSGNVDAAVSSTDSGLHLEAEGHGRFLALGGDLTGPFLAHLAFAEATLMQQKPAVLKAYLVALFETLDYARAHPDETIAITGKKTGLTPALGRKMFDILMPSITHDGHFDPVAFKATTQALVGLGQVQADAMPADDAFFTEAFLK